MWMRTVLLVLLGVALAISQPAWAKRDGSRHEPRGKPFAHLRDQVDALAEQVSALLSENAALQRRLAALERGHAAQDGRLSALEGGQVAQNDRLAALEAGQTGQDDRLMALETGQGTQDSRLTTLESGQAAQYAAIQMLDSDLGLLGARVDAVEDAAGSDLVAGLADVLSIDDAGDVVISGANVYIQSGSGATNDDTGAGPCNPCVGKGNLIIGYNEGAAGMARTGSHNLVVGTLHSYTGYGGLVAGSFNTISGQFASVTGGRLNTARDRGSVNGGLANSASNDGAVGGGTSCGASGPKWTATRDPTRYIYTVQVFSPTGPLIGSTLLLPELCF